MILSGVKKEIAMSLPDCLPVLLGGSPHLPLEEAKLLFLHLRTEDALVKCCTLNTTNKIVTSAIWFSSSLFCLGVVDIFIIYSMRDRC